MSYRKLDVHGRIYEYTIGKQFVKFRGGDVVPKEKIGWPIRDSHEYMVTPKTILEFLATGKVFQGDRHCINVNRQDDPCFCLVNSLQPTDGSGYQFICNVCLAKNASNV